MKPFRQPLAALVAVVLLAGTGLALVRAEESAKLDQRLVSQLASARPGDLAMVFVHGSDIEVSKRAVRAAGMRLVDTFDKVGVAVATGTPREIENVRTQPGVSFVEADQPIDFFLQTSHKATRGEEALAGFTKTQPAANPDKGNPDKGKRPPATLRSPGVDGSGVSIAVIDSGVDGTHPMFQQEGESKVLLNLKFMCPTGAVFFTDPAHPGNTVLFACAGPEGDAIEPMFVDMTSLNDTDSPSAGGHGTHVAGIAAGVDVGTPEEPFHGAAPGAHVISLSVGAALSVYGGAAGLNWVLEHHDNPCDGCPPIKVVNNSWGSGGSFNPNDLRSKLQHALVAEGVTVVWAAGNGGGNGSAATTNPPSVSPVPGVLSVANYDDGNLGTRDGGLASSSSRGRAGDPATYPDISAPGSNITSACRLYLAVCSTGEDDPDFGTISGTSMAAPHIAGIVSQLIQAGRESLGRDLEPAEIEDILEDTAYQFSFGGLYEPDVVIDSEGEAVPRNADHQTSFDKGHGLVDVVGAVARIRDLNFKPGATDCGGGGPLALDGTGDASHPTVDLVEADISSEDVAGEEGIEPVVTFRMQLDDLIDGYPDGTNGVWYDYDFNYGGQALYVAASRRLADGIPPSVNRETFTIGQQRGNQLVTLASGLSGEFDFDADEVRIQVTQSDIERADEALTSATLPPLADGSTFTNLIANSRTQLGAGVFLVSPDDTAPSSCNFVVSSSLPTPPPPPLPEPPTPDGTISESQPEYTWTGGPTSDAGFVFGCNGISGSTCDEEFVEVIVPSGGGILRVEITAIPSDFSDESDYDLYLYGPDGSELEASENAGSNELIEVPVTVSGVYRIEVFAWLTVNTEYSGVVRLQ